MRPQRAGDLLMLGNVVLLILCADDRDWHVTITEFAKFDQCVIVDQENNSDLTKNWLDGCLCGNESLRYIKRVTLNDLRCHRDFIASRPGCLVVQICAGQRRADHVNRVDYLLLMSRGLAMQITSLLNSVEVLIRPSWDLYFLRLANLVSSRANCRKRRVGAVVVKDRRIVSTGYNGTPTGMANCLDGGCRRCCDLNVKEGEKLDTCCCLHAESNAILEAGREKCRGATMYVTCIPCLNCAKEIVQAEIAALFYIKSYAHEKTSHAFFRQSSIKITHFDHYILSQSTEPASFESIDGAEAYID
eukprot:Gregarina_sp_Poly_1__3079@NODE_1867_length_3162_cov_62_837480_g1211_i0_p2_GENE_NODE_1867_length_3162_cov_62_837480_g1211_i0NODE_1867_length_3162_cov_62_837480_g1211_i0_p2_ORF_typecomplete_len303_score13_34dCMP_cyt_deam_1/PF00383_23/8_6e23MafB19deam/PF14437_6/2_8e14APOBEC3/PF18771_1/0_006CCDC84/PF14968_6/0_078Bd3614deam/PF14439_6/1_6e03Bd3614deam/PF14439_6/0_073SNAD4/PF18750_1/0_62_NODE_1867_length_3162_cov_62_837480_g1211_i07871695